MKRKSILAAGLWVLGLGSAMAADVTLGTATPPVGAGVRNLSFSANDATNTAHAFVASDYLAADHPQGLQMGQSFTTGANVGGYLLTSISVRQVSWASNWDYTGGNVTLRVFDSSGGFSPSVQLVSQTAAVGGEDDGVGATTGAVPTEPMWLTFTLDAPLALGPNKLYSFALSSDGTATNDGFFMNLDGTSTDSYAGGSSISVDTTNSLWTGGGGSDRAFVAAMTVPPVPAIPVFEQQPQPESYIGYVGDDVTLSATAIGDPEPGYQWEFSADGNEPWTELTGETSSVLNIPFAEYADNGFFRVVASNTNGSATSNPATLDLIYPNPVITQQPQSTVVLANGTATISVGAESGTGLGTLTYEWYKVDLENGDTLLVDGGNISGSETFELQISNVSAADEGEYYAYVYDDAGEADEGFPAFVVSENATLTIGANLASVGTTTPAVADGVQNLSFSTDDASNTQHNNVPSDYIGSQYRGDALQMAQSFTSGPDAGYLLNSISVRQVSWGPTDWDYDGGFVTLRVFDLSGDTVGPLFNAVELASEVAVIPAANSPTVNGTPTAPMWLTFALSEPLALNPNTLYAFSISSSGGVANEGFFMNLDGTSTDSYAGGFSLTVDGANVLYDGGNGQPSDRAFVANMTSTGPPANDFGSWIGGYDVGGMNGFTQDPDFDGISSGVENFFGTDPSESSAGVSAVTKTGVDTFTFQHPQNATPASDVAAAYRWSLDLVNWIADGVESGGTTVSFSASPDTPVAGTTTVTATVTGTVPQKVFADIEVTKTDP